VPVEGGDVFLALTGIDEFGEPYLSPIAGVVAFVRWDMTMTLYCR